MFLHICIFVLSISLTVAVELDGTCTNTTQCTGSHVICVAGICQCDFPTYVACKSECQINAEYAYEGQSCEINENCIKNAACSNKTCMCNTGFTAKNGLCFKSLNAICTNNTECWSKYCSNSRCSCLPGYQAADDNISCKGKLVKIYDNWSDANRNREICIDDSSCIDALAKCIAGPTNTIGNFCKCPSGYRVQNSTTCELIISSLLSPLDTQINNYGECGGCEDENAACIQAADEKTCWCRLPYEKTNNQCEKQQRKPLIIFPNIENRNQNDFSTACNSSNIETNSIDNKLCVCAPGYMLENDRRLCKKIELKWINAQFEYGVCTRITSNDDALGVNGLCPKPLTCEARKDKHICTCGKDKFQDLNDPTQCVYFIGTKTNSTADKCPSLNSIRNSTSGICQCIAGYRAVNNNRQCEVTLSSEIFQSPCNSSQFNNSICTSRYGTTASFCSVGECRCSGGQSFPDKANLRCYAKLNETLAVPRADCPPNSALTRDRCTCNAGYRTSNDLRECIPLALQLVEYAEPTSNTSLTLTKEDCEAFFRGPVIPYTNVRCQCISDGFINDDKNGCWYKVNANLTQVTDTSACPPNSGTSSRQVCECKVGYIVNNIRCMLKANRVYDNNDPTAQNIPDLLERDCVKLFGSGSAKSSNGSYCVCRSTAFAVRSNTYCNFLINQTTNEIKGTSDCPANANYSQSSESTSACVCNPGYYVSSDGRTCRTAALVLSGAENLASSSATNCVTFTNQACIANFGVHAFCRNETCFCNRQLSFVNSDGKCESFSNYFFPGEHEQYLYSCTDEQDCGGKTNVVCDFLNSNSPYKVCQCKDGSLLDPKAQTCSSDRCLNKCDASLNFECRGYECVCKAGYYQNGGRCVRSPFKPQLNQPCNQTDLWMFAFAADNNSLECDPTCSRARCKAGYRPEMSKCVQNTIEDTKCVYQEEICQQIDENSICNTDANECWCQPSFYLMDNTCVRTVGASCASDEQCGGSMICKGKRCACNAHQRIEETSDKYGRVVQRCVNGIGRLYFSPILLVLLILARIFSI